MAEIQKKNLLDYLREIKDFRRGQGQRHNLGMVLLIVIMALMSGYNGIRAIGDFVTKHAKELIELFALKKERLPTFPTIGRILQNLSYEEFEKKFKEWAITFLGISEKEWIALDGKVIGGTVENAQNNFQKYTNLVSAFSHMKKQVLGTGEVGGNKKSEIPVTKDLIRELGLTGVVLTLDALHCQKDTCKAIIETKNDYVIGVKRNQKNLHTALKKTAHLE